MLGDASLLKRLNDFALDDESAQFKFSDRLARENGWSLAFAKSAIVEYKRFVYLAATSPTPVTPSDVVDQVWHLHLTYTRSYWGEMCGEILGRPLHHGPTSGGKEEDAKYRELYAATLDAYRREFDADAPSAFWPATDLRFAGGAQQRWVDTRKNLVLSWRSIARTAGALAASAIALEGVAFAAAAGKTASGGSLPLILGGGAVAVALLLFAALSGGGKRRHGGGGRGNRDDGSTSFIPFIGSGDSSRDNHHSNGHGHDGSSDSGCSSGGDGGSGGCSGGGGCSSS